MEKWNGINVGLWLIVLFLCFKSGMGQWRSPKFFDIKMSPIPL